MLIAKNPINKFRAEPIDESGEEMLRIPKGLFVLADPHPYVALSAPYGNASPWMLRKSVLDALVQVQDDLQKIHPGWKLKITDAYRPDPVQIHMVRREFRKQAEAVNMSVKRMVIEGHTQFAAAVHSLWARPVDDPAQPSPHSTGAAVDLTFADEKGREVNMGSPIDENSPRSHPNYFRGINVVFQDRRDLLRNLMVGKDFSPDGTEWWHYSRKDQAWACRKKEAGQLDALACYGNAAFLKQKSFGIYVPS